MEILFLFSTHALIPLPSISNFPQILFPLKKFLRTPMSKGNDQLIQKLKLIKYKKTKLQLRNLSTWLLKLRQNSHRNNEKDKEREDDLANSAEPKIPDGKTLKLIDK